MAACLLPLVLFSIVVFASSPAQAGNYSWASVAAPSRVAGTAQYGVVSVQETAGTNGEVRQFHVDSDGVLRVSRLAAGKQSEPDPPTGTRVAGGLGRLGWISDTAAVGPAFDNSSPVVGGAVYFSGKACTDDWTCRYGVYMRACRNAACSEYLLPTEAIGFPVSKTRFGWTQNAAASSDGWVFLLRVEQDEGTGSNRVVEVWARNVRTGSKAVRLATNSAAGYTFSGDLELVPGLGGQLTVVIPAAGRAALYTPGKGWKPLP